jgi:beta-lactamase regulating signal transducer with metallopeptidase domain
MIEPLFTTALDASVRVVLLAAGVGLVLHAARVRSSGVRHAAWTAVLLAMLLMPVLRYFVPSVAIPIPLPSRAIEMIPTIPDVSSAPSGIERSDPPAPATSRPVLPAEPAGRRARWPVVLVILYGVGALFLLLRLLAALHGMSHLARRSRRITLEDRAAANVLSGEAALRASGPYESTLVATPLIAGVFRPRIILPTAWTEWPDAKLRAVLAHEIAHIRRRDPLVRLLARVNRCLFWFHPLAWWLERTLAATAEHACDDAGVRAIGEGRRYAEVLLDMADAARQSGGRLSWQGVGVDGDGFLGQRIDRVLGGDLAGDVSLTRKVAVGASCAVAIVLAVACRQLKASPPLQPDPKVSEQQARTQADQEVFRAARAMTPQEVADLEASWKQHPEDLAALKKLLIFYAPDTSGKNVENADRIIAARRPLILWLIEHHPDSDLAGWNAIYSGPLDWLPDPAGYAAARTRWIAQTRRSGVTPTTLGNAAFFFEVSEQPLAEQLLLRAQAMDRSPKWSRRLGELYFQILVGSNAATLGGAIRSTNVADARSTYAQEIRRKLADSTDAELIAAAGSALARNQLSSRNAPHVGFDTRVLGTSYVERARQLNPASIEIRRTLAWIHAGDRNRRMQQTLRLKEAELAGGTLLDKVRAAEELSRAEMRTLKDLEPQAVSSLPEADRFMFLPELADLNYMSAESLAYTDHDQARADAAYARSKKYAEEALALAPRFSTSPDYGAALYRGNIALGAHALREGDRKTAVRYLLEAGKAPASEEIAYGGAALDGRLVNDLLKEGERDSIIEFLDRAAQLKVAERDRVQKDAAALRAGRMPVSYQYMMARQ